MRKGWFTLLTSAVLAFVLYGSCSTHTYMGRWLKWRASDIEDYQKFPYFEFEASKQPFRFPIDSSGQLDEAMVSVNDQKKTSLSEVIATSATTAFIIVRNDTLVFEQYASGYTRESINTSFSTAKSVTALLVGAALFDGLIQSENDPVTLYLPELRQTSPVYDSVQISQLLDMRSGIQFKDHDLPWGDKPKAYYHPYLRDRIKELPVNSQPGKAFKYNSYNPILVGMILEKVTGQPTAQYFEKVIWNELGMEYSGSWSVDSEESQMTKMESGLNLRAIDFAKLGRLVLNKGNWNGKQVVPASWMDECTKIIPQHNVNEFGKEIYYENFWWLYSKNGTSAYIISGWGHLGQYLYVFPEKNMIIVRMGREPGPVKSWGRIFKELSEVN